jgi:hypothetical protein
MEFFLHNIIYQMVDKLTLHSQLITFLQMLCSILCSSSHVFLISIIAYSANLTAYPTFFT